MKAPEKLYLSKNIYSTYLYQVPVPNDGTTVEYTRTDAFVEKACEFISLNVADYIDVTHKGGIEHLVLQERFIDAFKKYMKGK